MEEIIKNFQIDDLDNDELISIFSQAAALLNRTGENFYYAEIIDGRVKGLSDIGQEINEPHMRRLTDEEWKKQPYNWKINSATDELIPPPTTYYMVLDKNNYAVSFSETELENSIKRANTSFEECTALLGLKYIDDIFMLPDPTKEMEERIVKQLKNELKAMENRIVKRFLEAVQNS